LGPEELGDFANWLRSPAENVVVGAGGNPAREASTVNRKRQRLQRSMTFITARARPEPRPCQRTR
jgi:hypothetical protein